MKQITLAQAFKILQSAADIFISLGDLHYSLSELQESDENEFLYLRWEDDGLEYSATFAEGENIKVTISGSSLFLIDTEGDEFQITILQERNIEKEFDECKLL